MNDLVDIVGLQQEIEDTGESFKNGDNFESIYSRLDSGSEPKHERAKKNIEKKIEEYFSALHLPDHATIYDHLLLSLQGGDAVFTSNWDSLPSLVTAPARPVRVSFCLMLMSATAISCRSQKYFFSTATANWAVPNALGRKVLQKIKGIKEKTGPADQGDDRHVHLRTRKGSPPRKPKGSRRVKSKLDGKEEDIRMPLPEISFRPLSTATCELGGAQRTTKIGEENSTSAQTAGDCGNPFESVPLLYPVEKKGYSKDPYIRQSWEAAKQLFENALVITIFGYSAPDSDQDAVALLKSAWMNRSSREMEHVEVIDIEEKSILYDRWKPFTPTLHLKSITDFNESWIAQCPRRSREAVAKFMSQGIPYEASPMEFNRDLNVLQKQAADIAHSLRYQ